MNERKEKVLGYRFLFNFDSVFQSFSREGGRIVRISGTGRIVFKLRLLIFKLSDLEMNRNRRRDK